MGNNLRWWLASGLVVTAIGCARMPAPAESRSTAPQSNVPAGYLGKPYEDAVHKGGPQAIPGTIFCAYFDLGGEGVAYHTTTQKNMGSGSLNPADGSYLNEFRMHETMCTSYVKNHGNIDNNPYNLVQPPDGLLYVGWTVPGEWFNLTVDVAEAETYTADLLYTSNRGGEISFDLNGKPLTGPITIQSTFNSADKTAWRQWHHWNLMKEAIKVQLPKGISVLTVHVVSKGNMNLATLAFKCAPQVEN
jgi:hypothetical protein